MEKIDNHEQSSLAEIQYITPNEVSFVPTQGGFVGMQKGEAYIPRVFFYRCFPHSMPDEWISVRDVEGNELGMIQKLTDFNERVQELLQEQIRLRYFAPEILKIIDVKEEFGNVYWDVETSAGACRFTSGNGGWAIVRINEFQVLVIDIDGNRFEIPDLRKLPATTLKKMEQFI